MTLTRLPAKFIKHLQKEYHVHLHLYSFLSLSFQSEWESTLETWTFVQHWHLKWTPLKNQCYCLQNRSHVWNQSAAAFNERKTSVKISKRTECTINAIINLHDAQGTLCFAMHEAGKQGVENKTMGQNPEEWRTERIMPLPKEKNTLFWAKFQFHSLVQGVSDFAICSQHENQWTHQQHEVQENGVHFFHQWVIPDLDAFVAAILDAEMLLVNSDWDCDDERQEPHRSYNPVGMRECLPPAGAERLTDGEVTLQGDGYQGEDRHSHRHTWNESKHIHHRDTRNKTFQKQDDRMGSASTTEMLSGKNRKFFCRVR